MSSNNKKVKVLVVDDSAFMRKILSDILGSNETIEVIGMAKNGVEAIRLIKLLKPDVVTMDIEMPILNGIDALKEIMQTNPVPVIMLSSLTSDGAEATLTCLDIGAVDFIQKPSSVFRINIDDLKKELVNKINIASKVDLTFKNRKQSVTNNKLELIQNLNKSSTQSRKNKHYFIVIGTSTGGPRALQHVLPLMPKNIPASILIVQHMPPGFTKSLAERLNNMSNITVKEAEDDEKVLPGHAYIAPGNYHLEIKTKPNSDVFIKLSQEEPVSGHRPSVDALFKSVANNIDENIIAVIMTGMGADGSNGVKELKNNTDCYVIAQDEDTSVVYGMPKSAVNMGVVDDIVPLHEITNYILKKLGV